MTMKLRTWKYFFNQGMRGIFKNGLMSFASIVIVSACIFIVILSLCIISNVNYMLTQIESEIGVTLFLGDKPDQMQVDSLIEELENMPEVSEVTFKSAEDALEDAKEMYTPEILDGLKDDNPLPRSIEVRLKNITYQDSFLAKAQQLQIDFENEIMNTTPDTAEDEAAEEQSAVQTTAQAETATQAATETQTQASAGLFTDIVYAEPATQAVTQSATQTATQAATQSATQAATQSATQAVTQPASEAVTQAQSSSQAAIGDEGYEYQGIELISHAQQITDTLITLDTAFKLISIILFAILSVVSISIIMNTIKLTVFIRKTEISIMKYVGATDWFIRWPFIIEGIIIGLIGAIIPCVICTLGYIKLYDFFNTDYSILKNIAQLIPAMDIFTTVIPVALVVGMLIGAIGSISSIRRHLNV